MEVPIKHRYRTLRTPGHDGAAGKYDARRIDLSLFDMENDPYETRNVLADHAELAVRLRALAEKHAETFYPAHDADGIFMIDGSYLFVPDNARYEGSKVGYFDEHNHPISREEEAKLPEEKRHQRRRHSLLRGARPSWLSARSSGKRVACSRTPVGSR